MIAGCFPRGRTPPSGFGSGASVHTIDVGGRDRVYRFYKPAGLPPSAPLVVMLHGGFGNAEQAERAYGWNELADSGKFSVAYPDGLNRAWNTNGGGCCGRPAREGVDDIGFITAAVADIAKNVGVNTAHVYATGISNGGNMSNSPSVAASLLPASIPNTDQHNTSAATTPGRSAPATPYGHDHDATP